MEYLVAHHPDCRIASHAHQRARWHYSTPATRDKTAEYNHRSVLPEEVVIDIDDDTKALCNRHAIILKHRSDQLGLKGGKLKTGGKGYHFHYVFPEIVKVKEQQLMKRLLAEWIVGDIPLKWDRQLLGNHLVRMEGGFYEKSYGLGSKYKTFLYDQEQHFLPNKIPENVWKEYRVKVVQLALNRIRPREGIPGKASTPSCVEFFLGPAFREHRDGGKRALFVVASWFRELPERELFGLLRDYNRYNLKTPVDDNALAKIITSARKPIERPVGCNYRHLLLRDIGAGSVAEKCEQKRVNRAVSGGTTNENTVSATGQRGD